jgi:hypothetical protein
LPPNSRPPRYLGDPWKEVIAPWLEARTSVLISEVLDKLISVFWTEPQF